MAIDKEASRRWRRRIRDVLNTQWDPIGGCPEDEYDTYVGKIAAMIRDGSSDESLIAYLRWNETVNMGISARPDLDERLRRVVDHLRAIGYMN
jgi:hypothetical protein